MLRAWMIDKNSTNWSVGCYFVQFQKNCSYHRIIRRSPYKTLFGTNPKIGLFSTDLPSEIIKTLETEEDINRILADYKTDNLTEDERQQSSFDENMPTNLVEEEEGAETRKLKQPTVIVETIIEANNSYPMNVGLPSADPPKIVSESEEAVQDGTDADKLKESSVIVERIETDNSNLMNLTLPSAGQQKYINESKDAAQDGTETHNLKESNVIIEVIEADNCDLINVALPSAGPQENTSELGEAVEDICIDCKNQKNAACVLCSLQTSIMSNRNECHAGQKRAAEKMLSSTAKKLPPLKIGDCVLLPVEKIDRGPSDMQNLICVIVDYKNGVYQLGSSAGKIKGWYNRADIVAADSQFLNIEHVPNKYISVREAVSGVSLCDGQGYLKCSCKPSKKQCQTNRCVCLKKKLCAILGAIIVPLV